MNPGKYTALALLAALATGGCNVVGPRAIEKGQFSYNEVINRTETSKDIRLAVSRLKQRGQPVFQVIEPPAANRDRRHDRHAKLLRKHLCIEFQPVALRQIDHVERDDYRQAQRDELKREAQMIVEIGGVDHDHQRIGQAFARLRAGNDIARHPLIGAGGVKAIGTGQIDQLDRPPVVQCEPPRMALDRHARIIADFLPRAGQCVEQRALSGIGIADQCN